MFLIFDVETTGFIKGNEIDFSKLENFPRIVQLAFQLHDERGKLIQQYSQIIKPEGFEIPYNAAQIHKITTERALKEGIELKDVLQQFINALKQTKIIAGHNIANYDIPVIAAELIRAGIDIQDLKEKIIVDTCTSKEIIEYCQLPGGKGGGLKQPKLEELYEKLFGEKFELAHNAAFDVQANACAFFEILKRNIIAIPSVSISVSELQYEAPDLSQLYNNEKGFHQKKSSSNQNETNQSTTETLPFHFAYLHNHTIYSIGNSTTKIEKLVEKAAEYKASALAITDLGYMSGVIDFYSTLKDVNKTIKLKNESHIAEGKAPLPTIKPIIGCEFYLCEDITKQNQKYQNFQIPVLAKNEKGYTNLCKLSSIAFIDGFYYVPRIDRKNLLENKDGLIVLSGWIYGEIPQALLNDGEQKAEEVLLWYKNNFGENFYLELNNHFLDEEKYINTFLIKMAEKHQIKAIAAQNHFYLKQEDADAFDTLICIRNGEEKSKPIGKGSGKRYGLPNNEFYFKSPQQIKELFSFYPQAITNAIELAESIDVYSIEKEVVLPKFDIPKEFATQYSHLSEKELENEYLKYLAYEGAKRKYKVITEDIQARIDFELQTIVQMGFPGYFLIVSDILSEARKRGIRIGPGRGSAAGSIIAYVLDITNVDPIRYNLLFERFLNPERVSMPDIDIDIADDRRDEVIQYIVEKYGREKVANIITFSELGGKSAIRDAARTLGLMPDEVDKVAKSYTPLEELGIPIDALLQPDKIDFAKYTDGANIQSIQSQFKKLYDGFVQSHPRSKEVLEQSAKLTGCFRHTGIHACGLIIAPKRLDEISPLAKDSRSGQVITQLDVGVAEKAGLLKMDFLGLTTLSIITNTLRYIKENKGIELDIDAVPLNDEKTFDIFRQGHTDEIFQFESPGMKKYLQQLKPDSINDLIAMNALYRPGPMKYIDSYIKRKHGLEKIEYDFPEMEEYLKETYGITVYQEQVMLLSQKLAGFTKGQADELRKAMGKKKLDVLQKMEQQFFDGCKKNGFDLNKIKKIWEDWKDFASYAFNKSHSVCYALLAYQTAYLKAHYPSEFMCAALNTKNNIDDIAKVLTECNRMQIKILPPDINESVEKFNVLKDGSIRFGLSYIKNVGKGFAEELIESRKQKGKINHIFEIAERLSNKSINKKNIENLAQAGVFDSLPKIHRAMFFVPAKDELTLTEKIARYAESMQKKQVMGSSLFDTSANSGLSQYPEILSVPEWDTTTKLIKEKEVLGLFISGNPLDEYKLILKSVRNMSIKEINDKLVENPKEYQNKLITIIGWAAQIEEKVMKSGKNYYTLKLEDSTGSINLFITDEMAEKSKLKYNINKIKCYLITGKIENRNFTNDPSNDRWEFKVKDCVDLDDVLSQKSELKILLNVKDIQLDLIKDLEKMFKTNGGISVPVSLIITDDERKNYVSNQNTLKINFNEDNLNILDKYRLEYKLVIN
ncbi:MAG: DNA polymerase III subunit alpha [Bacteroidia bacterium]|nr:DNA polymerase III subunit alpha [Bacteroidia bacterium]